MTLPNSSTQSSGVTATNSNQNPLPGSSTQTGGVTGTNSNQTPRPDTSSQSGGVTEPVSDKSSTPGSGSGTSGTLATNSHQTPVPGLLTTETHTTHASTTNSDTLSPRTTVLDSTGARTTMSSSTPAPSEVDGGSENIVFIIETSVAAFTVDVQDKFRKALTQIYEVELLGVTILSIETYDEARRRLLQLYIDRIKVSVLIKYDRIPSLRNPIAIDALSTKMAEDGLPSAIVASVTVIPIKNNISTPAPKDDVERPFWAYFLREWGWFFLAGVLAVILVCAPILVVISAVAGFGTGNNFL